MRHSTSKVGRRFEWDSPEAARTQDKLRAQEEDWSQESGETLTSRVRDRDSEGGHTD